MRIPLFAYYMKIGSMGRVVCELLSTQNVGPKWYVSQILHYYGSPYRLLMNVLLDKHWYGFGGMQDRFDSNMPPGLL